MIKHRLGYKISHILATACLVGILVFALALPIESSGGVIDRTILASSDDCWADNTTYFTLTSEYFWLIYGSAEENTTGGRWLDVSIPQGAIVTSAYVTIQAQNEGVETGISRIFCEDADNPSTFSDWADFWGREKTIIYVDWEVPGFTQGEYYNTPDLSSIIQPVVDRSGFASDSLVLIFEEISGEGQNRGASWDQGYWDPPLLHIEYTLPESPPPPPVETPFVFYIVLFGVNIALGLTALFSAIGGQFKTAIICVFCIVAFTVIMQLLVGSIAW